MTGQPILIKIILLDIIKQNPAFWLQSVSNAAETARMVNRNFLKWGVYMKIRQRFMTTLAALMICCFFTVSAAKAEDLPDEAPMFSANIEWSPQGYIVKGTFTEFPSDISRAETLYSLDGKTYQTSGEEWNITEWSVPWTDMDETELKKFQNQACLHSNSEPLKSYLAGKLECFYVKLRLTRENGTAYVTQAAIIAKGSPGPVPEEMTLVAKFASSIAVRTFRPFSYYGRYQITVGEDATPDEISACLPDTLPVEVELQKGLEHVASGIIDCPVTWKPLAPFKLTAGESVTIQDAAEEIVVPGGTMLDTPLGTFQLNESLGINQHGLTDEVRLILNVTAKGSSPTGALACENDGLQMVFYQKPTKATAIRAYTLSDGETEWTELPDLPLLQAVNAQPSTPNSGYTYVLRNDQEPYRSYLADKAEGREPSPFLIGFKIEGGVYNGQKLILAWPDTYELPLDLPELGGSGGNEANAGADNTGDSTAEGQRPNLPGADNSGENEGSSNTGNKGSDNDTGSTEEGQWPAVSVPGGSNRNNGSADTNHNGCSTPDNKGDSTEEGQRPSLPQNTAAKDSVLSGEKSSQKNSQNQGNPHMAGRTGAYAQTPKAAQAASDTIDAAGYPAASPSGNVSINTQTESLISDLRSAQDSGNAAPILSDKEEKPIFNSENSSKFLIPILTAMATGLCAFVISIAVLAGNNRFKKQREK